MEFDAGGRRIREPIAEGVFYPSDPDRLENEIRRGLSGSSVIADRASAIIAPYASYTYCGKYLASAYKSCAARHIERVIIVGPCHRDPEPGVIVPESTGFRIPTGIVAVDEEAVTRSLEAGATLDDLPHLDEHSIEVQLPFIRYLYPRASIVPLLVPYSSVEHAGLLAGVLSSIAAKPEGSDLLVISANISGSLDRRDAKREAGAVLDFVLACDWEGLETAVGAGEVSAAGAGCIAAGLRYVPCADGWEVLDQGDSCSVDGDPSSCVEYAAVASGRDNEG